MPATCSNSRCRAITSRTNRASSAPPIAWSPKTPTRAGSISAPTARRFTTAIAVVNLRAVGAEIEPALVGVLGDHAIGGADEARFVLLVMARHREFEHVAGIAFDHVLQDGAVFHEARRNGFHVL